MRKSNTKNLSCRWLMPLAISLLVTAGMVSCQESLEDRAAREAAEFTQKSCPTPERDHTITDSMSFDIPTHTFIHYYTLTGPADNANRIVGHEGELHDVLVNALRNNTMIKRYKDAGYTFRYVYRSQKDKSLLFDTTIKAEEYQ